MSLKKPYIELQNKTTCTGIKIPMHIVKIMKKIKGVLSI